MIRNTRPSLRTGLTPLAALLFLLAIPGHSLAADSLAQFRQTVQPLLAEYCYDCHGDGAKKGNVAFDELDLAKTLADHDLWLKVLKNTRAGLMPPQNKPKPSAADLAKLEQWIKYSAFGIDPANPDPGRVTVRRLNRTEYRNTIRDLTGFDFKVEDELPPDDTGYGFDNIGDVLSISPLLLEKYMQAAELIAANAVPRVANVVAEKVIPGAEFRKSSGTGSGERLSFYDAATVARLFNAEHPGQYRITLELEVLGQFDFDPGKCNVLFKDGEVVLWEKELGWQPGKKFQFDIDQAWSAGEHPLAFELKPITPLDQKKNSLDLRITSVRVQGPKEQQFWVRPRNFNLFFTQDPPESPAEKRAYARQILTRFTQRAYRRPPEPHTIDRLLAIAENAWTQPGKRFEDGFAQAIVPVLASPRFLFRVEDTLPSPGSSEHPLVDEFALASRLSYFLWSTMPDDELFQLAQKNELRKNLDAQVQRMLAHKRSEALVQNFVGQWLQTRDVEGIDINARVVLARDSGEEFDFQRRRQRFQELNAIPDDQKTPEQKDELRRMFEDRRRRFNRPQIELDRDLRRAMREETEMAFAYVLRENRSLLELINADYTFLNENWPNITA